MSRLVVHIPTMHFFLLACICFWCMSASVTQTIRANPAGNVLQRQISNGRGTATSMGHTLGGEMRMSDVRSGLESASSLGGASSSSAEAAQELSDKLWQVLMEGVQPFMQWELQSGMGDFWEQVCPSSHDQLAGF